MKVHEEIEGHEVVLIDSGATHNFISEEIVKALNLSISPSSSHGVVLETKGSVRAAEICEGVLLTISDLTIIDNFLPLPLDSENVILGISWRKHWARFNLIINDLRWTSKSATSLFSYVVIVVG